MAVCTYLGLVERRGSGDARQSEQSPATRRSINERASDQCHNPPHTARLVRYLLLLLVCCISIRLALCAAREGRE